jgi:acyl carrier protein
LISEDDLKGILIDVLLIEDDDYRDEAGPEDLAGWDSFGTVEIVAALERSCGWLMDLDDMVSIRSIGDLKVVLRRAGVLG